MDIISKDKKEIQWKGLPRTNLNDIEELKVSYLFIPSIMLRYACHFKYPFFEIIRRRTVGVSIVNDFYQLIDFG